MVSIIIISNTLITILYMYIIYTAMSGHICTQKVLHINIYIIGTLYTITDREGGPAAVLVT